MLSYAQSWIVGPELPDALRTSRPTSRATDVPLRVIAFSALHQDSYFIYSWGPHMVTPARLPLSMCWRPPRVQYTLESDLHTCNSNFKLRIFIQFYAEFLLINFRSFSSRSLPRLYFGYPNFKLELHAINTSQYKAYLDPSFLNIGFLEAWNLGCSFRIKRVFSRRQILAREITYAKDSPWNSGELYLIADQGSKQAGIYGYRSNYSVIQFGNRISAESDVDKGVSD